MFNYLFKGVLAAVAIKLLDNYRQLSLQLLKIEVARCYLHAVRMARRSAISLMQMGVCIALIGVGLLLLHAGLFLLLPWSVKVKALLGVCLGLAYVACGVFALRSAMTEKAWMKKSGAVAMLEEARGQAEANRPAR